MKFTGQILELEKCMSRLANAGFFHHPYLHQDLMATFSHPPSLSAINKASERLELLRIKINFNLKTEKRHELPLNFVSIIQC